MLGADWKRWGIAEENSKSVQSQIGLIYDGTNKASSVQIRDIIDSYVKSPTIVHQAEYNNQILPFIKSIINYMPTKASNISG